MFRYFALICPVLLCAQTGSTPAPSVHARLESANALFRQGKLTDAAAEAERILGEEPGNTRALELKANCAYLRGNFEEAKTALIRVLDSHPGDEDAAYMLGRMYYQEGYVDLAIGLFRRVLKSNPKAFKAWDNLGLCYQAQGSYEEATRDFLTAIKLVEKDSPHYDWPYANLADLLIKTGKPQMAYDAAAKAAERNPLSARNFYLGGKALEQLGRSELAMSWLRRSASLDASYPEPWYLLSRMYMKSGDVEKAEESRRKFEALSAKAPAKRR